MNCNLRFAIKKHIAAVMYVFIPPTMIPPAPLTVLSVLLLFAAVQSSALQVVASRVGLLFPATLK